MNLTIETLNLWGARALDFAWPILWQSSLLIGLLFALDFALRRRVRAAVRYALWLVVLLKLLLPPALALPTGLGWWLRPTAPAPAKLPAAAFTVSYGSAVAPAFPAPVVPVMVAPARPTLSSAAWALMVSSGASLGLLVWMLLRWRQVARDVRQAGAAPEPLRDLLEQARRCVGLRRTVRLGLTERPMSPAVCGLFRPRILLPRSLAEQLPPAQLRAILVHELMHLRRGDVWVNCAQALLQLLYWWHPLLWLANARIRQAREEAVDDAVMGALREEAEAYAPTLLEVARLALQRPLTSLGLVGILESRSSLRQRIQRLLDFHPPRKAGLTLASAVMVLAFAAVAVPMGEAPAPTEAQAAPAAAGATNSPVSGAATNATVAERKHSARMLVRDGMLLYQLGKSNEANATLKQALALDPQNQAAWFYSNLVATGKSPETPQSWSVIRANPRRRAIYDKLNNIRLDDGFLPASTLGEALRSLTTEAKERDPDKIGINFTLVSGTNSPGTPGADLASLRIALKPSFTQRKLEDVLDEIVKSAERPVKYSVEDNGVVFSARQGQEAPQLSTRRYKVNPGSFFAGLHTAMGLATNADGRERIKTLRNFFAAKGAELAPPKSLYYNETAGQLYVKAEEKDLDIVEEAIQELNSAPATNGPPAAPEAGALGFPWHLHETNATVSVAASGTAPLSYQRTLGGTNASRGTNPLPRINVKVAFLELPEAEAQTFLARFSVTNAPGSNIWSTTLTPAQAAEERAQWESGAHVTVLGSPEATLLSGRGCQMSCTELKTVITDFTNGPQGWVPQPMTVELGPSLACTPALQADGYTIELNPKFSLSEFVGYADPRSKPKPPGGKPAVWPEFRHRELFTSSSAVRDGQTLVLGGLVSEQVTSVKDKVPVLGDLPLVGKLFRSQSSSTRKSHLFILITPTLVTAEGFPVHPEGEWAR